MSKHRPNLANQTEAQKLARNRMALFPKNSEVLYVDEELWVVRVFLEHRSITRQISEMLINFYSLWCDLRENCASSLGFRSCSERCLKASSHSSFSLLHQINHSGISFARRMFPELCLSLSHSLWNHSDLFHVNRQPESFIAPYLTSLSDRLTAEAAGKPDSERIRVGSYPGFQKSVTVSLVGKDVERIKAIREEASSELSSPSWKAFS